MHSSILAWGMPWMEEPGGLQSKGLKQSDAAEAPEHKKVRLQSFDAKFFLLSHRITLLHQRVFTKFSHPVSFQKLVPLNSDPLTRPVVLCFLVCRPRWLRRWRICLQCRRPGFDPWVGKIPWRREWLSTPACLPGESHGQRIPLGYRKWSHRVGYDWLSHEHGYPSCSFTRKGLQRDSAPSSVRVNSSQYLSWFILCESWTIKKA